MKPAILVHMAEEGSSALAPALSATEPVAPTAPAKPSSRLARWLRPLTGLAWKIVGLAVFSVALTITYFGIVSYRLEYEAEQETLGLALDRIAATAVQSIDGDAHRRIREPGDAETPQFARIRAFLERVKEANYLHEDQIYTFQVASESELRFAVMLQKKTFVGDPYHMVPENVPVLLRAWKERHATHTKLYHDDNGSYVSAYAPIFDSRGEPAGILEVDYSAKQFMDAVGKKVRRLVLISLIGLFLSATLSITLAVHVRRALRSIRRGVEAIQKEDYSYRISLARNDELGLMAVQVNRMAEMLSERFYMLKFLPRHTLEAIIRRSKLGDSRTCERVYGAVFFSDIRGYTALSAEMSDEETVEMLNQYLRRQAEIVEAHGGSIDKFMGDAVLAVFLCEGAARNAVAAALRIRAAVEELNQKKLFRCPVHIGIGVSCGEMVLGEIGSADRRERTPIGSVVNLASRLGSRAGSEEILVSDSVRAALGPALMVAQTQECMLKGFSEPQLAHFISELRSA